MTDLSNVGDEYSRAWSTNRREEFIGLWTNQTEVDLIVEEEGEGD